MSALSSPAPAPVEAPGRPVAAPPKPRSNKRAWLIGSIFVLIIAAGLIWNFALGNANQAPAGPVIRTAKAFVGPLEITIRLAGQTSARNFANITAPLMRGEGSRGAMTLLQLAASGTPVKKGQMVAQIDAQSQQDHIDDLKDTIQQAENDITKRIAEQKVETETLDQTLRVSKASYDKAKLEYSAAEVKTDIERELLKLTMDEAEARLKEQQKDISFRKAAQAAEIRTLQLTLERHKRHIGRHEHDLEKFTIYAPMDGLVVMATVFRGGDFGQVQQGDQIYPGQQILKIVDLRSMQVEATVSQSDSGDLRLNQRVRVRLDAFPDLKFDGKVYSIGALAVGGWRQNYYIRNVPVRVAVEGFDPRLIPDLSASANVIVETTPDQLQVPLASLHEENGKTTVAVKNGSGFETRTVELGKRSNTTVAVNSGLKAGDEVRLN